MSVDRCGYNKIGADDNKRANAKAHRAHQAHQGADPMHSSIRAKERGLAGKNGSVSGDMGAKSWSKPGKVG